MAAKRSPGRPCPAVLLICGLLVSVIAAALQAGSDRAPHNGLSIVLGIAAFVAGYMMVSLDGRTGVSAAFIVVVLAAALLGPVSACLTAVIAEIAASVRVTTRPRPYMFAANLLGAMLPALAAAGVVSVLAPGGPSETIGFYAVVALAGVVEIALNFAIAAYYTNLLGTRERAQH